MCGRESSDGFGHSNWNSKFGLVDSTCPSHSSPYLKTHYEAKNHKELEDKFGMTFVQMELVETQLDKLVTTLREIEDMAKKAMKAKRRAVEETKETKRR